MSAPDPADIYKAQTSMLQWLRRRGHKVDFSPTPQFETLPLPAAGYVPPAAPPLARYNGKPCPYCYNPMHQESRHRPTRDHIRPRRAGGTFANNNCLVVCAPCNNDKADMMLHEFAEWLLRRNDPRAGIVMALSERWATGARNAQVRSCR